MDDGVTVEFNTTPAFNRGIAGLVYAAGLNARTVVKQESEKLVATLVRITPKANPKKISDSIMRRFELLKTERDFDGKSSGLNPSPGVKWYFASASDLIGVAKDADKTKATVEELKQLLYKTTKAGNIRGRHGKQRVLIKQRITTKLSTVKKLIAAKVKNAGRLPAGWCVAVKSGVLKVNLPQKVARHLNGGTRGSFVNGLEVKDFPRMTISNSAKGISARNVRRLTESALRIRAQAMTKNALLFMSGKKKLSDYAKG